MGTGASSDEHNDSDADRPDGESAAEQDVRGASTGDEAAAARVVVTWAAVLERYLRKNAPRAVLERESAADLAQSVCREALERLRRGDLEFRGDRELERWLFGAADLKVKNRVRFHLAQRRAASPAPGATPDERPLEELAADTALSPSAALSRDERAVVFHAALAELDERQRECVRLFHLEGASHAEIAARLGVTESHSRTLVARALARLARLLRENEAQ